MRREDGLKVADEGCLLHVIVGRNVVFAKEFVSPS